MRRKTWTCIVLALLLMALVGVASAEEAPAALQPDPVGTATGTIADVPETGVPGYAEVQGPSTLALHR